MWCLPFVVAVVALSTGCGTNTSTQERQPDAAIRGAVAGAPAVSVPDNPSDREIRRHLNLAISHDDALKSRDISFIVSNGDVSVTGTVRTEEERRKLNELAMNIGGVKSVANGVLIAE
jgi:osmotically-inducible protein OsmY